MSRLSVMSLGLFAVVWAGIIQEPAPRKSGGPVSLLQVMAQPEKFHDKVVQVRGFLHLDFEGNQLHLHQEDFAQSTGNAFWVDATDEMEKNKDTLNDKYVIIRGTIDAKRFGHLSGSLATIKDISRCEVWSDPNEPRR